MHDELKAAHGYGTVLGPGAAVPGCMQMHKLVMNFVEILWHFECVNYNKPLFNNYVQAMLCVKACTGTWLPSPLHVVML